MEPDSSQITRYLLGRLSDEETHAISDQVLSDELFAEAVEEAEADLLDAYAQGTLPPADRAAIEQRLLGCETQIDKLRFARALAAKFHELPVAPVMQAAPPPRRSWLPTAGMAALAVLGFIAAGTLYQRDRTLHREISELRAQSAIPREVSRADSMAASFVLSPTQRSGGIPNLKIPADSSLVRLDLEMPEQVADVRVTVSNAQGEVVFDERHVPGQRISGGDYVSVWIRSASLAAGSFDAAVSIEKSGETLHYAFAVLRFEARP